MVLFRNHNAPIKMSLRPYKLFQWGNLVMISQYFRLNFVNIACQRWITPKLCTYVHQTIICHPSLNTEFCPSHANTFFNVTLNAFPQTSIDSRCTALKSKTSLRYTPVVVKNRGTSHPASSTLPATISYRNLTNITRVSKWIWSEYNWDIYLILNRHPAWTLSPRLT